MQVLAEMSSRMLFSSIFLLSAFLLPCVKAANNCPNFSAFYSNKTAVDVNCNMFNTTECTFITSIPQNLSGQPSIGRPNTFQVVSNLYRENKNSEYYPRIISTWTPSLSEADLRSLKGFVIYYYQLVAGPTQKDGPAQPVCRVFDLLENNFTDVMMTFNFAIPKMRQLSLYLVRLYSLPVPLEGSVLFEMKQDAYVWTQERSYRNFEENPKDWLASISAQVNNVSGTINVTFPFAPPNLNFTEYVVKLWNDSESLQQKQVVYKAMSTCGETSFENLVPGSYRISVQPYETKSQTPDCVCFSIVESSRNCTPCSETKTPAIFVNNSGLVSVTATTAGSSGGCLK